MDNQSTDDYISDSKEASNKKSKQTWARLIQKVYEVDPLICPYCNSEMKVVAIIQDRSEIKKIITCFEKKNKSPPVLENVL